MQWLIDVIFRPISVPLNLSITIFNPDAESNYRTRFYPITFPRIPKNIAFDCFMSHQLIAPFALASKRSKRLVLGVFTTVFALSVPFAALAQEELDLTNSKACTYVGTELPAGKIWSFRSTDEAKIIVDKIMEEIGLKPRFVLKSADVPTAAAIIMDSRRYILYSQNFVDEVDKTLGTRWASASIVAHEIGHHLNGHTLGADGGVQLKDELEADEFSGYVLRKMGAPLADAQKAMGYYADEKDTKTHPGKKARLAAIAAGWHLADDQLKALAKAPSAKEVDINDINGENAAQAEAEKQRESAVTSENAEQAVNDRQGSISSPAPTPTKPTPPVEVAQKPEETSKPAPTVATTSMPAPTTKPEPATAPTPTPTPTEAPAPTSTTAATAAKKMPTSASWILRKAIIAGSTVEFFLTTRGSFVESTPDGYVVRGKLQELKTNPKFPYRIVKPDGSVLYYVTGSGYLLESNATHRVGYLSNP